METITLEQLQELFSGLRAQTPWDVDGEMLWGYFFTSKVPETLERAGQTLEQSGYRVVGIFQSEDEPMFILHVERVEIHTPETLFARNQQFEAFATEFELESYDGMDVNPVGESQETAGGEGDEENDPSAHDFAEGEFDDQDEDDTEQGENVENPELLAAIDALVEEPSEEAQDALNSALQLAVFLVPVFDEPGTADDETDSASSSDDPEEVEAVQLLVCADEEGIEYLPLFTDVDSLRAWTSEPVSAMVLDAQEAWEFVLSQEDCSGAVVNPGGKSLPLERELIEMLQAQIDELSQEEEEEE